MKILSIAVAIAILACGSPPAHAQLSGLFPGKKPAAAGAEAPPTGDALITTYSTSQGLVVAAQASLSDALGLKDRLAQLQVEQKTMSSGQMDTDALKKTRALSTATQLEIDAAMAKQPELSAAAKTKFAEGLVRYFQAVAGATNLLSQASTFTSTLGANPMALMGKGRTAVYVGKLIPGYVKDLGGTSRSLLQYAKRNNIATPANATAELDGL